MGLISKQQAIEEIERLVDTMSVSINKDYCFGMRNMKERAISAVERIPEAITRCRDCKWYVEETASCSNGVMNPTILISDGFYCGFGRRKQMEKGERRLS